MYQNGHLKRVRMQFLFAYPWYWHLLGSSQALIITSYIYTYLFFYFFTTTYVCQTSLSSEQCNINAIIVRLHPKLNLVWCSKQSKKKKTTKESNTSWEYGLLNLIGISVCMGLIATLLVAWHANRTKATQVEGLTHASLIASATMRSWRRDG